MLSNKNQKYIFERLLKGLSVAYQPLDEDRFVFTDGVRLFIFSKEQIKFDISKCALGDRLKEFLDGAASGRMYTPSEEIRVNDNKAKHIDGLRQKVLLLPPYGLKINSLKIIKVVPL